MRKRSQRSIAGVSRRDILRGSGVTAAAGLAAAGAATTTRPDVYTRIGVRPFINTTATLTINTGMATASLAPNSPLRDSRPLGFLWLPVAGFALMGAGLRSGYSTRRRLTVYLLGGILCVGFIFQAACGGGSGGPGSTTYTVTITGTSGSTQHSATTTLTVR